jgi:hypothetical protein
MAMEEVFHHHFSCCGKRRSMASLSTHLLPMQWSGWVTFMFSSGREG